MESENAEMGDDENVLAKKISETISTQMDAFKATIQESLDRMQDKMQEQNEQNRQDRRRFCELEASSRLTEDNNNDQRHVPAPKKISSYRSVEVMPSKRRVYPAPFGTKDLAPTQIEGPGLRRIKRLSTKLSTEVAVLSHIAKLKHVRPQPEDINDQYDSALERLYLHEWPDAVPKYQNNHQCCRRDPERDNDARKMLRKVLPKYVFIMFFFAGAIPANAKWKSVVVTTLWALYSCYMIYSMAMTAILFAQHALCFFDPNCMPFDTSFSFTALISLFFSYLSHSLTIIFINTSLRDLLQSREMQTLICCVHPARIREPKSYWLGLSLLYWTITPGLMIYSAGQFGVAVVESQGHFTKEFYPALYRFIALFMYGLPPYVNLMCFFLVSHAVCLCFADWTTKMIASTATPLLRCEKPHSRLVEVNLLHKLKARVALSAIITKKTRVLLVPAAVALVSLFFSFLETAISSSAAEAAIVNFVGVALRQAVPLIIALYVSWKTDILENLVGQASLRKISDYLEYAPKGWMLGQKTSLNTKLLAKGSCGLALLFACCSVYVNANRRYLCMPWETQAKYEHFGTCADGIRTGLEQHMDCGRPETSCPQTCREKYGEYILIPADRECGDVDGYAHITTQRACALAFATWSRLNNKTNIVRDTVVYEGVSHGVVFEEKWQHADWKGGFRCGAYTFPIMKNLPFVNVQRFSFPALFSSLKTKDQESHAYLCYAGDRSRKVNACNKDNTQSRHFEEMIACPGPVRHKWSSSAWRNVSSPLPTTAATRSSDVADFRASRGRNGDCAEIQLHNSARMGAQVVFTLACNISANIDPNATTSEEPGIVCPRHNLVELSVESGPVTRGALMVSSTANLANMTVHPLGSKPKNVTVNPGSTLALVVDQSSDSMTVTLCF